MSFQSSSFLLRVAKALVEEVAQSTKPILDAVRERRLDRWKAMELTGDLVLDLIHAEKLCDDVIKADPNVRLNDGTTPLRIKAHIYFQRALIEMCRREFKNAVKYFEQSFSYEPDQVAYYNIGLCFLRMKGLFTDRTKDAIVAFKKCIELDPETEVAVDAGKMLARLGEL